MITAALIEALKSGRLGGIGRDVHEEEEGIFFEDLSGRVLQDLKSRIAPCHCPTPRPGMSTAHQRG